MLSFIWLYGYLHPSYVHFVDLEIFDAKEELNGRIWSLEVLLMKIEEMSFGGWIIKS